MINAHMRNLSSRWLCVACRFSRRSKTLRMQGCSTVCNVEQSGSGEVVGRCGGGPKELYPKPGTCRYSEESHLIPLGPGA